MNGSGLARTSHGVVLSLAGAISIGAWAVHLFAVTSLAPLNQDHHGVVWVMQAATVVTAVPCIWAIWLGWQTLRHTTIPEDEASPTGRSVFLAWLAVAMGGFSLLLIVLEAVYVTVIHRHA